MVLNEVAEVEERVRSKKIHTIARGSARLGKSTEDDLDTPQNPVGSGISDALRNKREIELPAREATPAQGQVVVQVGNHGSGGSDTIDKLAAFVLSGNEFDRNNRRRTALTILTAQTTSDEERNVLAAKLDEAIAGKQKIHIDPESHPAMKVARVGFDKLMNWLK